MLGEGHSPACHTGGGSFDLCGLLEYCAVQIECPGDDDRAESFGVAEPSFVEPDVSHELGAVKPWVDERGVPESDVTIETGQVKLEESLELARSEVRGVGGVVLDKLDTAAERGARKPGGLTDCGGPEGR